MSGNFIQTDFSGKPILLHRHKDHTRMIPAEHSLNRCVDEVGRLPVHDSQKLKEVMNLLETAREMLIGYIESEEFRKSVTVPITNVLRT